MYTRMCQFWETVFFKEFKEIDTIYEKYKLVCFKKKYHKHDNSGIIFLISK